jgi:hypothetical protein
MNGFKIFVNILLPQTQDLRKDISSHTTNNFLFVINKECLLQY